LFERAETACIARAVCEAEERGRYGCCIRVE
jgi:hypothetical protein